MIAHCIYGVLYGGAVIIKGLCLPFVCLNIAIFLAKVWNLLQSPIIGNKAYYAQEMCIELEQNTHKPSPGG